MDRAAVRLEGEDTEWLWAAVLFCWRPRWSVPISDSMPLMEMGTRDGTPASDVFSVLYDTTSVFSLHIGVMLLYWL